MTRLLICDDSAEARLAVKAMLEETAKIEVVGEASNGAQAVTLAVALELADLPCASFAATYLTAREGLSLAGLAGPSAVEGLASAPELAYRALAEGRCLHAGPQELAELFRLGVPCAEALAIPLVSK